MKMNWSRLEERLRVALGEVKVGDGTVVLAQLVIRLDAILASETRRGNAITRDRSIALVSESVLVAIEDEEQK